MKEGVFGMQEHVLDMSTLVVRRIFVFADRTDGVFVLQEVVAFFGRGIELVEERSADIFLPFFPWQVLIPMNCTCANRFVTRFYAVKRETRSWHRSCERTSGGFVSYYTGTVVVTFTTRLVYCNAWIREIRVGYIPHRVDDRHYDHRLGLDIFSDGPRRLTDTPRSTEHRTSVQEQS